MSEQPAGRAAGRVALITGTAGGQGAVAADLFAAEGATVVGCDVKAAPGVACVDLTDEGAVRRWVDGAAVEHGGIDVLYANAGATRFHPLEEVAAPGVGLRAAPRARRRLLPREARLAAPEGLPERGGRAGRLDRGHHRSMTNGWVAHTVTKETGFRVELLHRPEEVS